MSARSWREWVERVTEIPGDPEPFVMEGKRREMLETARYLFDHGKGIADPHDITGIDLDYNHDKGVWEIIIETRDGYATVIETHDPSWYDRQIRRNLGGALYTDDGVLYGPDIRYAYRRSLGQVR